MKKQSNLLLLVYIWMFLLLFNFSPSSLQGEKSKSDINRGETVLLENWLVAGPASLPLPAVVGENAFFSISDYLDLDILDPYSLWAEKGKSILWSPNQSFIWKEEKAEEGMVHLDSSKENPEIVFLASYIQSEQWQEVQFEVKTGHLMKAFLDGEMVLEKKNGSASEEESNSASTEIPLPCGKHRLLILSFKDPEYGGEWNVQASIGTSHPGSIRSSLVARRFITERDIFNSSRISQINISPDEQAVAYVVTRRNPHVKKEESWIEIRTLPGGELEKTLRDSQGFRNLRWSPDSRWLSAVVPGEDKTFDLWLIHRKTGKIRVLLDNKKGLSSHYWSPTGDFIIFTINKRPDVPKIEKMDGLQDRWLPRFGKSHIFQVMVDSGICRRLTAGTLSTHGVQSTVASPVSPDGSRILFVTNFPDHTERPYFRTNIYVVDLESHEFKKVFTSPSFVNSIRWSEDGENILLVAGQSTTGVIQDDKLHNVYDNDLFVVDPETEKIDCLTRDFYPSVKTAVQTEDGSIYMHTDDKSQEQLYRTDINGSQFTKVNSGVEVVKDYDISRNGKFIVYTGSSLTKPPALYSLKTGMNQKDVLLIPNEKRFEDIVFTKVEDFNFKNERGDTIEGWLHYPANFDPNKKYPLIVHYYGGTSHTARSFWDRLVGTHQHYAGKEYAVYVLNPSGAPGWGPEFSDLHVNDWGKIVSEEIITGVKKLLSAKSFLDPERVGAYGGSYGGFMTMLLTTKTDLFRACIPLYGISNITSYWGSGWWGFWYCGLSAAESFPWNRRDIYVDQSPIFHANKINTPLLLLHGKADINVPLGGSEQMYTALKLLGKEVEYFRFAGEDHGIRGTDKNRHAVLEIMLAWWNKYLKDQPEAWEEVWESK